MSMNSPLHELKDEMPAESNQTAPTRSSKKRKRENPAGEKLVELTRVIKQQRTRAEDDDLDLSEGINKSFAHMNSQLLADYIAQRTRKFESDLSSIELEDRYITSKHPVTRSRIHSINSIYISLFH
jgi:protein CMS1